MKRMEAIAAVLFLSVFLGGTVAHAGCAHPTPLSISGSTTRPGAPKWFEDPIPEGVAPGSSITVAGKVGCVDTGDGRDPIVLSVLFVQGDKKVEIGRVTSNRRWVFETKVALPDSATAGAAALRVEIVAYPEPQPIRAAGPGGPVLPGGGPILVAAEPPKLQPVEQQAPLMVTTPKR